MPVILAEQVDPVSLEFKTSLGNMVKPQLYTKYKN